MKARASRAIYVYIPPRKRFIPTSPPSPRHPIPSHSHLISSHQLAADAEVIVKTGADLLDRLIGDIVVECSTTYVSPSSEPLNPVDDQPSQTPPDAPASLPRNTAFSLPRFIPLLSERIYTQSAFTRQFLVKWIDLLNSIPDLELVSFLPRFLDGLIKFLNDPNEEVRTATSKALAEFLREIREAADLRREAADRRKAHPTVRQTISTGRQRRQIKPDATASSEGANGVAAAAPSVTVANDDGPVAIEPSRSGASEDRDVSPKLSELIPTPPATEPFSPDTDLVPTENDKGDWVPGQGVIVEYAKIIEILMPHLSSADEEIQQTALRWINEFVVIAKDVVIQFTPKLITPVLPSLAHQNPTIKAIAVETNNNLQKLILDTPFAAATPPSSTNSTASQPGSAILQMSGIPQLQQQIRPPTPSLPTSNPTSPTSAQFPVSATTSSGSLTAASPPAQSPLPSSLALRASLAEVKGLGETPALLTPVDPFDYQATVNALMLQLLNEHEETRVASLEWLLMLHKKAAHKVGGAVELVMDNGTVRLRLFVSLWLLLFFDVSLYAHIQNLDPCYG